MKELILNADDFGLTPGVNEGIIRAHLEGILTSATLMANRLAFDDAVERARATPTLGVGCHLVLVGGPAIAPVEKAGSLVDAEGRLPPTLANFMTRVSCGMIRRTHIERELHAQIAKIRAAGIEPTHLDTHKHTHVHPRVMEALGKVAHETGISRVRNPFESIHDSWRTTRGLNGGFRRQLISAAAARTVTPFFHSISRKYALLSPGRFLGVALTGQTTSSALREMFASLEDGRTEIMLHPGICDADLAQTGSRLQAQRQNELTALLDQELKGVLAQRDIRLISFRELI
jgi:chitin disaccharide deacetylase